MTSPGLSLTFSHAVSLERHAMDTGMFLGRANCDPGHGDVFGKSTYLLAVGEIYQTSLLYLKSTGLP